MRECLRSHRTCAVKTFNRLPNARVLTPSPCVLRMRPDRAIGSQQMTDQAGRVCMCESECAHARLWGAPLDNG